MKVSTPGRICLFGEHQDYLGLPVIAAAISKRVSIDGYKRTDNKIIIHKPNLNQNESFILENPLNYEKERDYFKSAINILRRKGFVFERGFEITIDGNIPINSGTSSSTALVNTWIKFLTENAENPTNISAFDIAKWANEAEVTEFGEPGGMMDHFSTALGNIIYLEFQPEIKVENLTPKLGKFILVDSLQPKDTIGVLKHVKYGMLDAIEKIKRFDTKFDIHSTEAEKSDDYKHLLSKDELLLLKGNFSDRDILLRALTMFRSGTTNHQLLGNLLNIHQTSLREAKRVSTSKIDKMIDAALVAGAFGGKINGSGGGGCMFVYAPENTLEVEEAILKSVDGNCKTYIIDIDEGIKVE